jgi:hypothetical protein
MTPLLRSHRLVSARWRVRRPAGQPRWFAHPVAHDRCDKDCPCGVFEKLTDALTHAETGVRP